MQKYGLPDLLQSPRRLPLPNWYKHPSCRLSTYPPASHFQCPPLQASGFRRHLINMFFDVADSSRNLDEDDHKIMELLKNKKSIILLNKSDLSSVIGPKDLKAAGVDAPVLWISAANEDGLDTLEQR